MKLMAIDGNSLINRAFYGVRPLSTRDGTPTNAVYGFLTILFKLLDEEKPDALCVTFDVKAPTFRHQQYADYKGTRKPMPEDLAKQLPLLKEVLDAMNIPRYELSGWEADDLLGTIAAISTKTGWDSVIVTGDKDSLQLISDRTTVKLVTTRMGQTTTKNMTPEAFREAYGFDPIHIIDLKALMGDTSDNIPGVKGIGEKTAMALIQEYGSIQALYAQMPNVNAKPAALKKLQEGEADAKFSYDLATIRCDAPLSFTPEETKRRDFDRPRLHDLFLKLEFSKLMDRLGLTGQEPSQPIVRSSVPRKTELVEDSHRMEELLAEFEAAPFVTCLALEDLNGLCVVYGQTQEKAALFLSGKLEGYNGFLRSFFSAGVKKVSHDVKPLMNRLLSEGLSTDGFLFDTALAAYLLSPTDGSYDLPRLAVSYCNLELPKSEVFTAADAFSPLADLTPALEAWVSHTALVADLYPLFQDKLTQLQLDKPYYEIDLPLCPVLAEMERQGILIDRPSLVKYGEMLAERIRSDEETIYALAGKPFNINSPKQLGVILFEEMGLPPIKKTKTGYSTNAEVLEKLRGQAPIVDAVLDYRQLAKLKSTYVDGLLKAIASDGKLHTTFQNTVTATGRLSSAEPNLQNIPVRTELGAQLRNMLVAGPGNVLVDADYSQIELRLLAHIANDATMLSIFSSGGDIHTATASQVFNVPVEEVTAQMRRSAKAVNFGIVYGISAFSLSDDLHIPMAEAKEYIDRYLATFHGVRDYMARIVEDAKAQGYVTTLFGRRRDLPELKSSNFNLRSFGERVALNMPIQGTAADLMKLAMLRVRNALQAEGLQGRLVLQIHDELIVECPEEEAPQVQALLEREMTHVYELNVPLVADAAAGKSWGEAKG